MPSLPASDGFQNPVQSSGLNSKICNPTNQLLDRSVSAPASICSSKSRLAEPIDPRAVKCFESPTECQITPEKEHPLLLQHLSNNASVANNDPSPQTGESESTSEIPAKYNELSNLAAEDSSSPSSIHQLDVDPGKPSEEPCFSLASALKELHKLLVISRKGASPPPAFPAADVDRILGAGFTTQEALEALEQADGNADLALLILLAKSIVVPT
ncbi:PREDICTED: regulatory solute carrier protein family 1 member 1 [Leptosomus discolor]|uniref:regulatory solute carrier protein family 1 member 1 n=1 Tax=Leptosomus discolor TaxID=188344 RepID=UPI000522A4DE|nr:PREDICTED: regulatory solute carrier protein family 1 member 1 [Leptosomus discolor]